MSQGSPRNARLQLTDEMSVENWILENKPCRVLFEMQVHLCPSELEPEST